MSLGSLFCLPSGRRFGILWRIVSAMGAGSQRFRGCVYVKKTIVAAAVGCVLVLGMAGCRPNIPLGFEGPYPAVRYETRTSTQYPKVTVFYPETTPRLEGLPVVIFSVGWNQPRVSYESYCMQLAQWGYVAILRFYPTFGMIGVGNMMFDEHVEHITSLIEWVEQQNRDPNSPLYRMADTSNVGLTGHSQGASYSLLGALDIPQARAVVSLDVTFGGGDMDILDDLSLCGAKIMYIGSSDGGYCGNPWPRTEKFIEHTPEPTIEVTIQGADHIDFIDYMVTYNNAARIVCPQGWADAADVRAIATRYLVAWFNVHLKGLTEFEDYYNGARAQADVDQELVTIDARLGR